MGSNVSLLDLVETLKRQGQDHIIPMISADSPLPIGQKENLIGELADIDWDTFHSAPYKAPSLDDVSPSERVTLKERASIAQSVETAGRAAYENGEVAVLLLAGGDGTRLGFNQPKGCFPIAPVSGDSLYQITAEKVLKVSRDFGKPMPFIVMTGPSTDQPTRDFFAAHNYFGLEREQLVFFQQASVPTVNKQGKLLLKAPGKLLTNPNGHGGTIQGMIESGALDLLVKRGIKDLVYVQIDNGMAPIYDPFTVGLRRERNVEIINKVVTKTSPQEKMGALVKISGKDCVVEYSELNEEEKLLRNSDGSLLFGLGNVAAHVISVDFLDSLRDRDFKLPYHHASKNVTAWNGGIDAAGQPIMSEVAATKRETFFFDILAHATCICAEVSRESEFAPVKNKDGVDSPETARSMMSAEAKRWVRACGVEIANDVVIEIKPTLAASESQFKDAYQKNASLREQLANPGKSLVLS